MENHTINSAVPRGEHPRPDFRRANWMTLNGAWQFAFDDDDTGLLNNWHMPGTELERSITVPFAYQTELSGIGLSEYHPVVWYKRQFEIPGSAKGKRAFLCFGAVDYESDIFIDGECVFMHTGGYTPFTVEATRFCKNNSSITVAVRVADFNDPAQPRGKQYWKDVPDRCWYTPCTGIWQSVWLEFIDGARIETAAITPDIDNARAEIEIDLESCEPEMSAEIDVAFDGKRVAKIHAFVPEKRFTVTVNLAEPDHIDEVHYWWPHSPRLYDVSIKLLKDGVLCDEVNTYFGMRKVAIENGRFLLNNQPYYLKMVLDQGYWRQSGLTPPGDEAIVEDIKLTKEFGFNGARKHQKIEDPRYYYWADKLGLLVWGELPAAYRFGRFEIQALSRDLQEFIHRDRSHPSIVAWVPINESWGVRKIRDLAAHQSLARALYHLAKACDPSRPVISNDGWELVETDITAIHDYSPEGGGFNEKYGTLDENLYPMHRRLLAMNEGLSEDAAAVISEYGGIALKEHTVNGSWGYFRSAENIDELVERFAGLTRSIFAIRSVCGLCYTQLSDVYQEVNGLLDFDHKPKLPPERIAGILNER